MQQPRWWPGRLGRARLLHGRQPLLSYGKAALPSEPCKCKCAPVMCTQHNHVEQQPDRAHWGPSTMGVAGLGNALPSHPDLKETTYPAINTNTALQSCHTWHGVGASRHICSLHTVRVCSTVTLAERSPDKQPACWHIHRAGALPGRKDGGYSNPWNSWVFHVAHKAHPITQNGK